MALVLAALLARTGWLTVVRGQEYARAAEANLQSLRRLEASRGSIYDRAGRPVALDRAAYSVTYSRHRRSAAEVRETLGRLSALLDADLLAREGEILETRPSWTRHSLARRLTQSQVVAILERPEDFRGVRVHEDARREYPFGPPLAPVVGYMSRIVAEDGDRFPRPTYLPDDMVGRAGIERQYEAELVGKPGRERHKRDARGGLLEEPIIEQPARPGDDLVLALDAALQMRAAELLAGHHGAAVLMDANTGDVLVLATAPSFDPDAPWRAELAGEPVSFLNRAYRGGYPPGSTFKLMTAAAAVRQGWQADHEVVCTGRSTWPGWQQPFWCDARSGHGRVDLVRAIQVSCNATFYAMGQEIGAEALVAEARRYGFARTTGLDLPGEIGGTIREPAAVRGGEIMNLAIGQGAFVATPLQVAVAYAALANGGRVLEPRLLVETRAGDGSATRRAPVRERESIHLPAGARETLIEGLWRAVNEPGGTALRARFPRHWQVCGKTGTAENSKGTNDAWFACFYPREAPEFVVVVVIEDTGAHGGDAAAPLARELIAAQRGESAGVAVAAGR
ncbi:MAG: hypothetical protein KF858_11245 [Candidatus Sumerlaeia bacterium]|nr:hypothetical protein [Candidatus Sumerlaeia bacterium]